MRAKDEPKFATEVELCKVFLDSIDVEQWTAYAETAGWDILLVRKLDGAQIGVQAKLRINLEVFSQTLDDSAWSVDRAAPDYRAILVPSYCSGAETLAAHLGISIVKVHHPDKYPYMHRRKDERIYPQLPTKTDTGFGAGIDGRWHEWCPQKRHPLPEFVPDVAAGASAPLQLTRWKIAALRILALLETRGYVTRADFKQLHIDHRRWLVPGYRWLLSDGAHKDCKYTRGPKLPPFDQQHPVVYAEILAKMKEAL